MTISAVTSSAAGISTSMPSAFSTFASVWRRGEPAASAAGIRSACAMTAPPRLTLTQLADGLFEQIPGLIAVFAFPLSVEAGRAQLFAERSYRRLVEGQALAGEFLLQAGIELCDIGALVDRSRVDVLGYDGADVLRHFFPCAAVGEEPKAVPHVVGQRAELLHLIELGGRNDRQRI